MTHLCKLLPGLYLLQEHTVQREDTAKNVATTEVGGGNKRELYTRISLCYLSGDELLLIKKLLAKRTVEYMSGRDHHG